MALVQGRASAIVFSRLVALWASLLILPKALTGNALEDDPAKSLGVVLAAFGPTQVFLSLLDDNEHDWKLRKMQYHLGRAAVSCGCGAICLHVLIILFGAPVTELVWRTFALALLSSITALVPASMALTFQTEEWVRVLCDRRFRTTQELFAYYGAVGALAGCYIGAFPIPLDWDRPWQAWPLTCSYGIAAGYSVGLVIGLFAARSFDFHEKAV